VISKKTILGLVTGLLVLIVTFSVLMGGYGLTRTMGDTGGAATLWSLAMACLLIGLIDMLLLLMAIAIRVVGGSESSKK